MKITVKAVTFQNNWPDYNWNQHSYWTAESGTTLVGNDIEIEADKAGASFLAHAEWTGSTDKKAPHAVRIVRASDGVVIATSPTAAGSLGTVTATATADVVAGEQYRMEFYSESNQPGTITPSSTYLQIT